MSVFVYVVDNDLLENLDQLFNIPDKSVLDIDAEVAKHNCKEWLEYDKLTETMAELQLKVEHQTSDMLNLQGYT